MSLGDLPTFAHSAGPSALFALRPRCLVRSEGLNGASLRSLRRLPPVSGRGSLRGDGILAWSEATL